MLAELKTNTGIVKVDSRKVSDLEQILKNVELSKHITEVILFGSAARGDCTDDSDIDLCVLGIAVDEPNHCELMDVFAHANTVDAVIKHKIKSDIDYIWYKDRVELEADRIPNYPTTVDDILDSGIVIYKATSCI